MKPSSFDRWLKFRLFKNGLVAQWIRAFRYERKGCRFESCQDHYGLTITWCQYLIAHAVAIKDASAIHFVLYNDDWITGEEECGEPIIPCPVNDPSPCKLWIKSTIVLLNSCDESTVPRVTEQLWVISSQEICRKFLKFGLLTIMMIDYKEIDWCAGGVLGF